MPEITDRRLESAELLTRAVENVFRKLIRFLVGRISLVRLQEMIRYIYVEETEIKLRDENPGRAVPMTKMALATGLDSRTLIRVRERLHRGEQQFREQFLAELTPESAVVEAWAKRVREGEPAELGYGRDDAGFERLVRATVPTRGVTPQSILQRLLATHSVAQDTGRHRLRLLVDHYSPYLSDDQPSMINAAFSAISNLISTIEHNVESPTEQRLFQRQAWTFRLKPADRAAFRQAMRAMLERYEEAARRDIEPWEQAEFVPGLTTAGVGLYYFEES